MARSTGIVITLALLAALLLPGQVAGAAIPADYQIPIDNGITWLLSQQDMNPASPGYGSLGDTQRVEKTSLAVIKMIDRSRELGEADPLQGRYGAHIRAGLGFILGKVRREEPDMGSIWDSSPYPLGSDPSPPPIVIETSAAIMALMDTETPGATAWTEPGGRVVTCLEVIQDAVGYLERAQMSGPGEDGGWPSFYQDPWIMAPYGPCTEIPGEEKCLRFPLKPSQWHSGFATLALFSAGKEPGITIDAATMESLRTWIGRIQAPGSGTPGSGGSYLTVPDPLDEEDPRFTGNLWTGYLLFEQNAGDPDGASAASARAVQYLENNWGPEQATDPYSWDYQTLYATMRGLDAWNVRDLNGEDWFGVYTEKILREQDPVDGSWPGEADVPDGRILPTEWALLVLEGHWLPAQAENYPPVAGDQHVTTDQGVPIGITLLATDPESDPLVFTVQSSPGNGALDTGTTSADPPVLTYTPESGFFGDDSFTFLASDGSAPSNIATVSITVKQVKVNVAPVADSQTVSTNENTPREIVLTATDQNGDQLTYEVLGAPVHGILSGSAPTLTYQPATNWYGEDSFTFRASDGELTSGIATVSITVVHENQPPVVDPPAPGTFCLWPPNHKYSDVSITTVTDPDGDPLTITITKIMSDEPMDAVTGAGGKNHVPDATGIGDDTATLLRAERSGNNNGRVYTISFTADDGNGGTTDGTISVCVPHDQSQKCICTDDGPLYDATL